MSEIAGARPIASALDNFGKALLAWQQWRAQAPERELERKLTEIDYALKADRLDAARSLADAFARATGGDPRAFALAAAARYDPSAIANAGKLALALTGIGRNYDEDALARAFVGAGNAIKPDTAFSVTDRERVAARDAANAMAQERMKQDYELRRALEQATIEGRFGVDRARIEADARVREAMERAAARREAEKIAAKGRVDEAMARGVAQAVANLVRGSDMTPEEVRDYLAKAQKAAINGDINEYAAVLNELRLKTNDGNLREVLSREIENARSMIESANLQKSQVAPSISDYKKIQDMIMSTLPEEVAADVDFGPAVGFALMAVREGAPIGAVIQALSGAFEEGGMFSGPPRYDIDKARTNLARLLGGTHAASLSSGESEGVAVKSGDMGPWRRTWVEAAAELGVSYDDVKRLYESDPIADIRTREDLERVELKPGGVYRVAGRKMVYAGDGYFVELEPR